MPGALAVLAAVLTFQGCSVYYNTYFNAAKAHRMALAEREDRLRQNPDDSVVVTPQERALLVRAVTKSSKVLELWPDDPKYAPKAVFLIAESQFLMEDYGSSVVKYDEYIRYFPEGESVSMARVRLAQSYYRDGKDLAARDALQEALAAQPEGDAYREAMLLAARMRIDGEDGSEGFALYEQLLNEGAFPTPEGRNEARWRAAELAYELGAWEKARTYALAAGEGDVPSRILFRNARLAVLALYEQGRHAQGLDEVRELQGRKEYRTFRPDLKVLEARAVEALGDWEAARTLYRDAVALEPRTGPAAEAWYRLGRHALDVDNDETVAGPLFDSAATSGPGVEFGRRGDETAQALRRLADLRRDDTASVDSTRPHHAPFMIAEIFRFDLPKPDSARRYLRRIVSDSVEDTAYTPRALYALADLERSAYADDGGAARADSLYRVLLARYPATEWAKQAEINLGLPATVKTPEDSARSAFRRAEETRLSGGDALAALPGYRAVAEQWPATAAGARARYVMAVLAEQRALRQPDAPGRLDSVKVAWTAVQDGYRGTRYAEIASEKLNALNAVVDTSGQPVSSGDSRRPGEAVEEEVVPDLPADPRREQIDTGEEQDLY